ncbi:hypothetical protein [[Limnothrix rosea] IAM M-220]|uniref:hypothetical protein n=1 Tax=[Limnothrix rosea] IAM M-220 TaxID=454133 RepID=UPI0015C58026|nr:hypothetical protein [[Limnothrix rosea] IAM M-220]
MSIQTVLETALIQNFITPEMKAVITQSLWSDEMTQQQLNMVQILAENLKSGKTQVIVA